MPKLIALISKQPELSAEEFRQYYEAHHAPLIAKLLPMIARYTRSYLPTEPAVSGKIGTVEFDVLTELWFADEAALQAFWARIRSPEVIAQIRADEANFLLSERTLMYQVQECGTELG